jgi:hypothetical protein
MKPWRDIFRVHPAAEGYPQLKSYDEDLFAELVADIGANELRETVKLIQVGSSYTVIDGRNRLDALEALGRDDLWTDLADGEAPDPSYFEVRHILDDEVEAFVRSANDMRRHLSAKQKRAWAASELQANPEQSNRASAEKVGISHSTVAEVRQEEEAGGRAVHVKASIGKDGKAYARKRPKAKPAQEAHEGLTQAKPVARSVNPANGADQVVEPLARAADSFSVATRKAAGETDADPVVQEPPARALSMEAWEAATAAERKAFVLGVTPSALVDAIGAVQFWRGMTLEQCEACDAESELERAPARPARPAFTNLPNGLTGDPRIDINLSPARR